MKKYFLLLVVSLLFASCKSYIQIYDVDSSSAKTTNEQFVFENEDCKLTYNFWEEWGNASMVFTNKTDKNLFVSLSQSSYIFNGFSSSFYKGIDDHVVISKFKSKTFRDLPVVCVAPKSSKVIGDLNLIDKIYFFCEKEKDKPKRRYSENYNENNSPINKVNVENKSGSLLPSTGGMGTTIFYIAGAFLVLISGVVLIAKKRTDSK